MKKLRKLIIIGSVIIIGIGACGCNMKKNDSGGRKRSEMGNKVAELVLNERQKEILEEVGLPTDVEELTYMQKRDIIAIDEMLTAMEEKYNRSFSYAGYIAPGPLEKEQLFAYPTGGDEDGECFAVTRIKEDGEYVYEDMYVNVVARPVYMAYVLEYCETQLGEGNVKVYSVITHIKNKTIPIKKEDIDFNISGDSCILMDGEKITEEDYNNFLCNYKKWTEEHGIEDDAQFVLLKERIIQNVTEYNYTDYLAPEYYLRRDFQN